MREYQRSKQTLAGVLTMTTWKVHPLWHCYTISSNSKLHRPGYRAPLMICTMCVWRENDAYPKPPPAKQLENFPNKYITKYAKQFTHNQSKRQIYTN